MAKRVSELTPEEFQKTFPIVLKPYNPAYKDWYEAEKELILRTVSRSDVVRIQHIGSSAVPGLIAKPIVDILMEIDGACRVNDMLEALKAIDFGVEMTTKSENPFRVLLTKGMTCDGFAEKVFFLHVRYLGDWNEPYFRDYLLAHPDAALEYGRLKEKILDDINAGRLERMPNGRPNGYSRAKLAFVQELTAKARQEFGDRYKPKRFQPDET